MIQQEIQDFLDDLSHYKRFFVAYRISKFDKKRAKQILSTFSKSSTLQKLIILHNRIKLSRNYQSENICAFEYLILKINKKFIKKEFSKQSTSITMDNSCQNVSQDINMECEDIKHVTNTANSNYCLSDSSYKKIKNESKKNSTNTIISNSCQNDLFTDKEKRIEIKKQKINNVLVSIFHYYTTNLEAYYTNIRFLMYYADIPPSAFYNTLSLNFLLGEYCIVRNVSFDQIDFSQINCVAFFVSYFLVSKNNLRTSFIENCTVLASFNPAIVMQILECFLYVKADSALLREAFMKILCEYENIMILRKNNCSSSCEKDNIEIQTDTETIKNHKINSFSQMNKNDLPTMNKNFETKSFNIKNLENVISSADHLCLQNSESRHHLIIDVSMKINRDLFFHHFLETIQNYTEFFMHKDFLSDLLSTVYWNCPKLVVKYLDFLTEPFFKITNRQEFTYEIFKESIPEDSQEESQIYLKEMEISENDNKNGFYKAGIYRPLNMNKFIKNQENDVTKIGNPQNNLNSPKRCKIVNLKSKKICDLKDLANVYDEDVPIQVEIDKSVVLKGQPRLETRYTLAKSQFKNLILNLFKNTEDIDFVHILFAYPKHSDLFIVEILKRKNRLSKLSLFPHILLFLHTNNILKKCERQFVQNLFKTGMQKFEPIHDENSIDSLDQAIEYYFNDQFLNMPDCNLNAKINIFNNLNNASIHKGNLVSYLWCFVFSLTNSNDINEYIMKKILEKSNFETENNSENIYSKMDCFLNDLFIKSNPILAKRDPDKFSIYKNIYMQKIETKQIQKSKTEIKSISVCTDDFSSDKQEKRKFLNKIPQLMDACNHSKINVYLDPREINQQKNDSRKLSDVTSEAKIQICPKEHISLSVNPNGNFLNRWKIDSLSLCNSQNAYSVSLSDDKNTDLHIFFHRIMPFVIFNQDFLCIQNLGELTVNHELNLLILNNLINSGLFFLLKNIENIEKVPDEYAIPLKLLAIFSQKNYNQILRILNKPSYEKLHLIPKYKIKSIQNELKHIYEQEDDVLFFVSYVFNKYNEFVWLLDFIPEEYKSFFVNVIDKSKKIVKGKFLDEEIILEENERVLFEKEYKHFLNTNTVQNSGNVKDSVNRKRKINEIENITKQNIIISSENEQYTLQNTFRKSDSIDILKKDCFSKVTDSQNIINSFLPDSSKKLSESFVHLNKNMMSINFTSYSEKSAFVDSESFFNQHRIISDLFDSFFIQFLVLNSNPKRFANNFKLNNYRFIPTSYPKQLQIKTSQIHGKSNLDLNPYTIFDTKTTVTDKENKSITLNSYYATTHSKYSTKNILTDDSISDIKNNLLSIFISEIEKNAENKPFEKIKHISKQLNNLKTPEILDHIILVSSKIYRIKKIIPFKTTLSELLSKISFNLDLLSSLCIEIILGLENIGILSYLKNLSLNKVINTITMYNDENIVYKALKYKMKRENGMLQKEAILKGLSFKKYQHSFVRVLRFSTVWKEFYDLIILFLFTKDDFVLQYVIYFLEKIVPKLDRKNGVSCVQKNKNIIKKHKYLVYKDKTDCDTLNNFWAEPSKKKNKKINKAKNKYPCNSFQDFLQLKPFEIIQKITEGSIYIENTQYFEQNTLNNSLKKNLANQTAGITKKQFTNTNLIENENNSNHMLKNSATDSLELFTCQNDSSEHQKLKEFFKKFHLKYSDIQEFLNLEINEILTLFLLKRCKLDRVGTKILKMINITDKYAEKLHNLFFIDTRSCLKSIKKLTDNGLTIDDQKSIELLKIAEISNNEKELRKIQTLLDSAQIEDNHSFNMNIMKSISQSNFAGKSFLFKVLMKTYYDDFLLFSKLCEIIANEDCLISLQMFLEFLKNRPRKFYKNVEKWKSNSKLCTLMRRIYPLYMVDESYYRKIWRSVNNNEKKILKKIYGEILDDFR